MEFVGAAVRHCKQKVKQENWTFKNFLVSQKRWRQLKHAILVVFDVKIANFDKIFLICKIGGN